jgi:hypothetical protein
MNFNGLKSSMKLIDISTKIKWPINWSNIKWSNIKWPIDWSNINWSNIKWPIKWSTIDWSIYWPIKWSTIDWSNIDWSNIDWSTIDWDIFIWLIIIVILFIIHYQINNLIKHHLSVKKSNIIIRQKLITQIKQLNKIISKYDNIFNQNLPNIQIPTNYNQPIDKLYLILYIQSEKINFLSKLSDSLTNDKTNMELIINNLKSDNLHLNKLNEDLTKFNEKLEKDIDFLRPKSPILELNMSISFDIEAIMKLMNSLKQN